MVLKVTLKTCETQGRQPLKRGDAGKRGKGYSCLSVMVTDMKSNSC